MVTGKKCRVIKDTARMPVGTLVEVIVDVKNTADPKPIYARNVEGKCCAWYAYDELKGV